MPSAVYLLGFAVFALGTSEFMFSGLVQDVSADLHVSIPDAGLLTSAFAIGMIFGAPLLAVFAMRWPRRPALAGFLIVFIAAHLLGAACEDFGLLLGTRVLGALGNAGFWAVAQATAMDLVSPERKGRAMAIVLGGVSIACVVGVPAGALLGARWGWRSAFLAVAVLTLLALVALLPALRPHGPEHAAGTRLGGELRALADARLLLTYTLNALVQGATFCTSTYLAPLLTGVARIGARWVPVLLVLFGLGAFLGIAVGGRIADARPYRVLGIGMTALLSGWLALLPLAGIPAAVFVLVFVQGMLGFGIAPALSSRAFYLTTGAATLTGAFTTAAFNIGNTVGPWFGGLAIGAGFGYRAPVAVSALLMVLALGGLGIALRINSNSDRR
ncbi:Cmx/CmrA family chloramphenicol efflux MFS transporter [Sciscionella marina]|uniref:Cmx/CmrA family chloramphenicol efflux MFS transporter n=1 Tax=Sciscionella marina TaxID=508770 RepID=UPI000377D4F0|nr:Cmx/CmrA family chloramphenicol efflux MFS transporter [Sciscionella marina]